MNYLAHLFLSGPNEALRLGGFIADTVKGDAINNYKADIKSGIFLHRKIDTFTDTHPAFLRSVERLKPNFKRYSAIVADIYYDHFLNVFWTQYSDENIEEFVKKFYVQLVKNYMILPGKMKLMLPFLIYNNWLLSYGNFKGLQRRFEGFSKQTNFNSGMQNAVGVLNINYDLYKEDFLSFFNDVCEFAYKERIEMLHN